MVAKRLFLAIAATSSLSALQPSIVGGVASDATQDATVLLIHFVEGGKSTACTGTLVAPNLVLTGRHCVASFVSGAYGCLHGLNVGASGAVRENLPPADLYVFAGKERPFRAAEFDPARWPSGVRGARIFDDGAKTLCSHDLALLLLERSIDDAPIATLRLEDDVRAGELLVAVGHGVTLFENEPAVRQQRRDVQVRQVGPSESHPRAGPDELAYRESTCVGDSGGPLYSQRTGAVVGIVSRGTNYQPPDEDRPAASCVEADNFAMRVAAFRPVIDQAFAAAGTAPRLEPWVLGGCR